MHTLQQMRLILLTLTAFAISCKTTDTKKGLFEKLTDSETVIIYLNQYELDSVPPEIGNLRRVKSLYIAKDSVSGWTILPPLSAIQQLMEIPSFPGIAGGIIFPDRPPKLGASGT
jgi:hypothetical protein